MILRLLSRLRPVSEFASTVPAAAVPAAAVSLSSNAPCGSSSAAAYRYSTDSRDPAEKPTKLHILKCTKATPTPHSHAVAFMLSKDQIPRDQLHSNMDTLSQQLLENISSYSSTELSAFTEACRQIGYFHQEAFTAMLQQLAPTASSMQADELPSLLWAGARLAAANTTTTSTTTSSSSSSSTSSNSHNGSAATSTSSRSRSSTVPVPSNDGICGSVSSSRIEGLPGVLEFVLGASQVLTGDMDVVASEELPVLAAALADMEYRDPFLLTALAETAMERRAELSEPELLALIDSFASMGRYFFDNRLLDQLTAEIVARAQQGKVGQAAVDQVAVALGSINHKNKVLLQYLAGQ